MRIGFLGNFGVDYSSESHYLKTLRQMGHEVITFQENSYEFTGSDALTLASLDSFFWVHTHGWHNRGLETALQTLKNKKIPIWGYHLDLWMGLERQKDLENDLYWKWLDYFFCTDKLMVDYLNANTKTKSHYIPAGVAEFECYTATADRDRFPHEIIFTGSKGYHHEWPYRPKLIDWLQTTYGEKFGHYGNDGVSKGQIRGDDLNVLYASAKIVIGDTLCKGFNYPYYFSDRLFEVVGRGGFMIFPIDMVK